MIDRPALKKTQIIGISLFVVVIALLINWVLSKPRLQLMAFYEQGWNELTYGLPSLKARYRDISIFIPHWYTLTEGGELTKAETGFEPDALKFAKAKGLKTTPLINNAKTSTESSSRNSFQMLTNPNIRREAIREIVNLVAENDFDGVNIDFQLLPPELKESYTQFIRELSEQLRPKGKLLSVDVFPQVDVLREVSGVYDYRALAPLVDFIVIMTYDRHSESTEPGPVAPYDWVEANVRYALDQGIPRDKLVITVAAYGYDWPTSQQSQQAWANDGAELRNKPAQPGGGDDDQPESLGLKEATNRAQNNGAQIKWDDRTSSPFFTYDDGAQLHEVWFENGFSAAIKAGIARKYGLRGVAVWRLGYEDDDYWLRLKNSLT